jgi:signal transduction histidine kinase/ActR/RegA family two-component response regulator
VIVVLPLSVHVVRQIIADAKRLQSLTGKLAGEVRQRTEERDRAERALIESERLAALGRLAAGVGHEISNPLTYMQLALDEVAPHLERSAAPAAARSALEQAREGAFRIQKVVEGLRSYSRRQDERRSLDPRDVVRSALRVAGPSLRHVARIRTRFSAVPRVLGDEPRLVQAFVNLLTNAAQAVAEHDGEGVITVTTATGPHGEAQVIVADTGAGVAPGQLPRLSEPYFTTRGKSGGLGLGLFVTRGIVDAHAGQIEFASEPGEGMHVKVVLPPAPEAQPPEPEDGAGCSGESGSARVGYASASVEPAATEATSAVAGAASAPAGVGSTLDLGTPARSSAPDSQPFLRRLLLIDDEELVRQMLSRVLRRSWQVETASDGSAALEALEARRFDAVVCDLMMPGISGMDIAEELARRWPDLRVRTLFLTGGAITEVAERFLARPDVRYLTKPVQLGELDRTLNQLVDGSPMQIID